MELLESSESLEAFRRGDRDLLGDVYRQYVGEVTKMLRVGFSFTSQGESIRFRGISEPFRLQEAVQESFIHAFRQKARQAYDGSRPYGPYLATITRNLVIDRYRKKRTESKLFVHLGDMAYEDEDEREVLGRLSSAQPQQPDPEASAWRQQLAGALDEFIDGLEPPDDRILAEHLLGGCTQQEMAEALKTSRNHVRKRIRLIREGLLRHLKSKGVIGALEVAEVMEAATALIALGVVS